MLGAARVATYALIAPARDEPRVEIAAVAARDPARARAYAAEHGITRAHESYAALFADPDIDLVYVATPPAAHAEQALRAIAVGKHVLVEKPFALTAAEAARVLAAADAAGVRVFEAMHSPHHALWRRAEALVRDGAIGAVRRAQARFDAAIRDAADELRWDAVQGGGALMDLGVYPLAWVRRLLGEDFVMAESHAEVRRGVDARFSARLLFPGGAEAEVASSMVDPRVARLAVEGAAGRLVFDNPLAPQLNGRLRIERAGAEPLVEDAAGPSTYRAQLGAVAATLLHGAPWPFPPDDFVRSMAAIEQVRAAWG